MDLASAAAIVKSANSVSSKGKECVKVVVRCRPMSKKESAENRKTIVSMSLDTAVISLQNPAKEHGDKTFTFDSVYDESTEQSFFYDESAYPLVENTFEGFNCTIFAYGQTGCGKTFTMQGGDTPESRGVIPLSFEHIFENIASNTQVGKQFMVVASYLEIYNEEIRDLLSEDHKKKLELKEHAESGTYVKGLLEKTVANVEDINRVMEKGFKNRTVAATLMNEGSSRSHSIFTITIEVCETVDGEEKIRAGKLNLVDLAGSERQSKTGATGARLKEGSKINLSLSALGNVISALVDGSGKHIPYRDSKLTRLLKSSLGGNTKTVLVAAISPADYNYEETLSTLRFANRAKNIKNKPMINEDPAEAKLREYMDEIAMLRKKLEEVALSSTLTPPPETTPLESTDIDNQSRDGVVSSPSPTVITEVVVREVIPESHLQQQEALELYNESILKERNDMGRELETTALEVEQFKKDKEELENRLAEIQSGILGKEDAESADMEQAMLKQKADYRRAQIKLKAKKKKEVQLEAAKTTLEMEKHIIEEELKSAQSMAEVNLKAHKKKNTKYRAKLDDAREEITDLITEFQREREDLLDTIRGQSQQVKFLEQLMEHFIEPSELSVIWDDAQWIESEERWILPRFKVKRGVEKLPVLSGTPPTSTPEPHVEQTGSSSSKRSRRKNKKKMEQMEELYNGSVDDVGQHEESTDGNGVHPLPGSPAEDIKPKRIKRRKSKTKLKESSVDDDTHVEDRPSREKSSHRRKNNKHSREKDEQGEENEGFTPDATITRHDSNLMPSLV